MVFWPPSDRTFPSCSRVAVWACARVFMHPVVVQVPVLDLYNSALAKALPELSLPPATSIFPFFSNVAVMRAAPDAHAASGFPRTRCLRRRFVASFQNGIPMNVTDLLHPAEAKRTPTEQRTKPIKARGLKKADREVEFVFMTNDFLFGFWFLLLLVS